MPISRKNIITIPQNEMFRAIEILHDECYEVPEPLASKYNSETPFYVWDVGANIGLFTLYIKKVFPTAIVDAFEPSSDNIYLFTLNTSKDSMVTLHTYGLFSENKEKDFFLHPKNAGRDSLYKFDEYKEKTTIEVKHAGEVLNWMALPYIDILKIDTEGAEAHILGALSKEQLAKIKCIMVEYHNENNRKLIEKILEDFTLYEEVITETKDLGILKYVNKTLCPLKNVDV